MAQIPYGFRLCSAIANDLGGTGQYRIEGGQRPGAVTNDLRNSAAEWPDAQRINLR
jgi:hypothetical protein